MTDEYQIKAYPTLKWFSRGRHHEFRANKNDVNAMLNWIADRISAENHKRSTKLEDCKDINKYSSSGNLNFAIFYFGETYENLYKNVHMQIPDHANQLKLFHITDHDCAMQYKANYPGFMFYRNFETPFHPYKGDPSLDEYNKFIR
jgi:hypothetical protein